jgi:hypothetical protein
MRISQRFVSTGLIAALLALAVGLGFLLAPRGADSAVPAAQQAGGFYREDVFAVDNVVTIDETSNAFTGFAAADLAAFTVSCVEDSGTATLDIAVQRSVDGGVTWADIVAFTQLAATGAETKLYADLRAASAQMIGDRLRIDYDVTGTGQYTCDVNGAAEG